VSLTAIVTAIVTETTLTALLGVRPLSYWLMKHETIELVLALIQFATFFLSSAIAVTFVTRAILRRQRLSLSWSTEHLMHSAILYVIVFGALFAHVNCADNCEGLMLGAIKFWGLLAAGGICANYWTIRRATIAKPAF
jgi:hypothetical protein